MSDEKVSMEVDDVIEESEEPQDSLLVLAEHQYAMQCKSFTEKEKADAKEETMKLIKEKDMAPYYEYISKVMGWTVDSKYLTELKAKNESELKKLDAKIADAEKNLGETEVREGQVAKATFFARIGDKEVALKELKETLGKTVGTGQKIDLVFMIIRIGLAFNNTKLVQEYITQAKDFVEKGGDWERRNLLKVYEATYLVRVRRFKDAAALFNESVATFTCSAMYSYEKMVVYTVVSSIITLDRISFRKKVVRSPEILQIVTELTDVQTLIQSLYNCKYKELFAILVKISDLLQRDRYFAPHAGWWLREMRIVAYSQFLCSYRSVTLASMAETFGTSIEFLDKELARFIAAGRINCKVDQVNLVVETNRPDAKNVQYAAIISKGDALLNRIQKLSIELT